MVSVRAALALIPRLPRAAVLVLARGLGWAGYLAAGRLRRVGLANLEQALGAGLTPARRRRILRASCRNFALVALDVIWFSRDSARRLARNVVWEGDLAASFGDRACVCVTGHLGNWELLGQFVAWGGYPLSSVATPLKNPAVDRLFTRLREAGGQVIIPRAGAVRALLNILRRRGRVGLLLDQNTLVSEGGLFVDFFGLPATVSPAGAALACRTGARIVFGFCLPRADGRYDLVVPPPLEPSPDRASGESQVRELTQRIVRCYEEQIRRHPECWLWMYKRWKHIRPGDDPRRYLFYSTPIAKENPYAS